MTETVRDHFHAQVVCWRDKGGCTTFHAVHVHVDFTPHASGDPKCDGGTAGWSSPGSPNLVAFEAAAHARFPALKLETFNCRKIDGSTSWSQHSYWNAVDIMTPTVPIGQEVWDWVNGPYTPPPPPPPPGGPVLTDDDAKQLHFDTVKDWATQCDRDKAVADVLAGRPKRAGQSPAYSDQFDKTTVTLSKP